MDPPVSPRPLCPQGSLSVYALILGAHGHGHGAIIDLQVHAVDGSICRSFFANRLAVEDRRRMLLREKESVRDMI